MLLKRFGFADDAFGNVGSGGPAGNFFHRTVELINMDSQAIRIPDNHFLYQGCSGFVAVCLLPAGQFINHIKDFMLFKFFILTPVREFCVHEIRTMAEQSSPVCGHDRLFT
jgi:hypothetical protein